MFKFVKSKFFGKFLGIQYDFSTFIKTGCTPVFHATGRQKQLSIEEIHCRSCHKQLGLGFQLIDTTHLGRKASDPSKAIKQRIMFSCDIKRITKERALKPAEISKTCKNGLNCKIKQKQALFRMGIARDVTCDSVIITRDSVVIRSHMD